MPAQIPSRLLATARTLIQILATMGAQSLAILGAQRPLWKFEDNIFAHIGRQVHEVLALQFFVKHKLLHPYWQVENAGAPAAAQCRRRDEPTRDQYRTALYL